MDGKTEETLAPEVEQVPIDDWAAAFAALDRESEKDSQADTDAGEAGADGDGGTDVPDTEEPDGNKGPAEVETENGDIPEELPGGPGDFGGTDGGEDEDLDWIGVDLTEEQIKEQRESIVNEIRERTIADVAKAYVNQGARNTNGRLGATINDSDICKRDRDGVPRFYNPDTGREFTGDNPRRQAQEWVDDYNRELADNFNKTCEEYSKKLLEQEGGRIAIIEFAPKYKALDPVRRTMFESIIEDYEVTDKQGNIIAYSCDLDKALNAVNRQVEVIKRRFAKKAEAAPKAAPTGPALDTPSTNGNAGGSGRPQFKSIEEAMEWEQDQLLAKMKGNR